MAEIQTEKGGFKFKLKVASEFIEINAFRTSDTKLTVMGYGWSGGWHGALGCILIETDHPEMKSFF